MSKDFVFLEFPRPENEEVSMNLCTGLIVNEILVFENQYREVSDSEIDSIYNKLKQCGVIIGPKSISSDLQNRNWYELSPPHC